MINLLKTVAAFFLFFAVPIVVLDSYAKNDFISKFMLAQSLQIMGTILAIYVAAASSFLAILMDKEKSAGKCVFNATSCELKSNIIFVFAVFLIHFVLLIPTPPAALFSEELAKGPNYKWIEHGLAALQTTTFLLFGYALYELSTELFSVRDKLTNGSKNKDNENG